ncbi:NAD(P)H-dependent oxidoreductase [Tabrizicola sp.]|uniref:NAD(P)H-dependent oxidoreductase n=1 Tax=Tabrizicola sp. TaxID=2005166 RepID=UPI003F2EF398
MSRRILIANLHPARLSLSAALAQAYADGATAAGHEVRHATLSEMAFNPDFGQSGYRNAPALEPDLEGFRADLTWAEHLVLVSPMWWGGLPAKAKGLFDRAFLPGYAFDPRQRRMGLPKPLLAGRTGRLILTSDTPAWAFWLMYRSALKHQVQKQILSYVGIRPNGLTHFSPVQQSTNEIRQDWIRSAQSLGARAA